MSFVQCYSLSDENQMGKRTVVQRRVSFFVLILQEDKGRIFPTDCNYANRRGELLMNIGIE